MTSAASAASLQPKDQFFSQTGNAIFALRDRVLDETSIRDKLCLLETDQKETLLQESRRIVQQAPSLQALIVAKVIASYAYDEFQKRIAAAHDTSRTAEAATAMLSQMAPQLLHSDSLASVLQMQRQLMAHLQELQSKLTSLPSMQLKMQDKQIRQDVEAIFAAWIVQNGQETVTKLRDVAKSVFSPPTYRQG